MEKIGRAVFISCAEEGEALPVFRKTFCAKKVLSATLYATALGCYVAFLNGKRIGNFELEPGFDEMAKRKSYTAYDVTELLSEGENALTAVVGSGWWSGRVAACYGKETAFCARLVLRHADGKEEIVTDGSWKSARKSGYLASDIYDGESFDARVPDGWKYAAFDDAKWLPVCENREFSGEIVPFRGPHITVKKELERGACVTVYRGVTGAGSDRFGKINVLRSYAGSAFSLDRGETALVDFGQNFSGRERFFVTGERGTELTIFRGEVLNDGAGETARNNSGAGGSLYRTNYRTAKAETRYILRGGGEEYHSDLTYCGFRYLEITATAPVQFGYIAGEVLSSVPKRTGFLHTSHRLLNKFVENAVWGQLSNYFSVPTDCPQRDERLGWTADTQVFAEAGCFLADSKEFLEKYLVCMRDAQGEDGSFSGVAPTGQYHGSRYGGTGWADAGVLLPQTLYHMYGDIRTIAENWDAMTRYMDGYLAASGGMGGLPHWGDWLSFESNDDEIREILGVCYYAWDAKAMSEMARALQKEEDAARYEALYERERALFRTRYIKEGRLVRGEQSVCAHAILLGLLEEEEEREAEKTLLENLARNGNGLRTGFLGTKILLDVLTKIGRSDVAYSVLLSEECPSWLYQVKNGATTVWERWDSYSLERGFADVVMNSFNHYAYGAAVGWMFKTMAGINPAKPGFAEILLAPVPDGRVAEVEASYESQSGKIFVRSVLKEGKWTYFAAIPADVPAFFRLPAGAKNAVLNGKPVSGERIALKSGENSLEAEF